MKRFLLISDMHAINKDIDNHASSESIINSFEGAYLNSISPIDTLINCIDKKIDLILCPGDVTHQAEQIPFKNTWDKLHELSKRLNAKFISTIGNHDIDSRYNTHNFDAKEFAKNLAPPIPIINNRQAYLEFWSENYTLITENECNILVLNTAAFHGGGKNSEREIEHGRISKATLDSISRAINGASKSAHTNIVLCHHHPFKDDNDSESDYRMKTKGGETLIEVLESAPSPWVLIHGHTHKSAVFHGYGGGTNVPVIINCGTLGSKRLASSQIATNQFHILETDQEGAISDEMTCSGRLLTWNWHPGIGWEKAIANEHNLPHIAGFGYRGNTKNLANKVERYLTKNNIPHIGWSQIIEDIPELARMLPADFERLQEDLKRKKISILSKGCTVYELGRE